MVPQTMDIEVEDNTRVENLKFLHKGPIVMLTIICSTVTNGINFGVQELWTRSLPPRLMTEAASSADPMIGLMFFAFLSSVVGRKPVFITLFTLSILSGLLLSLPWQESVRYSFPINVLLLGGARIMYILAMIEYATPKHRFTYMLFEQFTSIIINSLVKILFMTYSSSYPYVLSFQIVLGLLCVVSACRWPESPYWLAFNGKIEESKKSFLWLRGQEGREELNSLLKERRSPGPLKLYWTSFFVAIATTSVSLFTLLNGQFWHRYVARISLNLEDPKTRELLELTIRSCGSVLFVCFFSALSYFVKRKVLFLLVCGISILFSYGIAIWMKVDPTFQEYNNRFFYFAFLFSDLISKCGPAVLPTIFCVEIIPVKYNTHLACISLLAYHLVISILLKFFRDIFSLIVYNYAYLPINTTLSMIGVLVYYFFAPVTKGKTLLEIQKAYTPELSDANPKEEDEAMERL